MQVKFFSFRLLLKGKGFFSLATNVANGSEVESTINDWLASQPSIRVSQVQQSVTGVSGIGDQFLYVTVWYEQTNEPDAAPETPTKQSRQAS